MPSNALHRMVNSSRCLRRTIYTEVFLVVSFCLGVLLLPVFVF